MRLKCSADEIKNVVFEWSRVIRGSFRGLISERSVGLTSDLDN
jgi:hypothetical protein